MLEKLKDNKKVIALLVAAVVMTAVLVWFLCSRCTSSNDSQGLKVTYSDGEVIKYDNFTKKFTKTKKITIENTSKKPITYDMRWFNVQNTLMKQDKFTYEITCKGDNCQTSGKLPMPASDFPIFVNTVIESKKKLVYTISIEFKGSEKNVNFTGELRPLVISSNNAS